MKPTQILNKAFPYLDQVKHRWIFIAIAFSFSIFFVNVFVPFNINRWSHDSGWSQFSHLSGFGIIACIVLIISQFVIRHFTGMKKFKVWTFLLWFLGELLIMSSLFILYQSHWDTGFFNFLKDIPVSFRYTLLGILIPYSLSLLIVSQIIQHKELGQLKQKTDISSQIKKLIDFQDEKGATRFSVSGEQLLYLESADNYVFVYFLQDGKPQKQMLRNSMKNIETIMEGLPMKRCHRSFLVNMKQIEFVSYEKSKCQIKLFGVESPVPVSRKFYPDFKLLIEQSASI